MYKIEYTSDILRISKELYLENMGKDEKSLILHNGVYKKCVKGSILHGDVVDTLPIMTSNSQSGITLKSSPMSEGALYTLFDKNKDTSSVVSMGYIEVDYDKPINISKYSIVSRSRDGNDIPASPRVWDFQGSNDGISWKTLDSQNFRFTSKGQVAEFEIENVESFMYYRINVTSNNGFAGSLFTLACVYLYGQYSTPIREWNDVTSTLPTSQQFISDGMSSLSPLLDREVSILKSVPMTDRSANLQDGETGSLFSKVIDLNKYFDIRSIKVNGD